jgi:hypothetical protein
VTRAPLRPSLRRAASDHPDILAQLASALLGVWLVLSTFLWEHFPTARLNTRAVGVLIAVSALVTLRIPVLRWATMALSGWLFTVTLLAPRPLHIETLWNDLLVAATVIALTLVTRGGHEAAPPSSSLRGRGAE